MFWIEFIPNENSIKHRWMKIMYKIRVENYLLLTQLRHFCDCFMNMMLSFTSHNLSSLGAPNQRKYANEIETVIIHAWWCQKHTLAFSDSFSRSPVLYSFFGLSKTLSQMMKNHQYLKQFIHLFLSFSFSLFMLFVCYCFYFTIWKYSLLSR